MSSLSFSLGMHQPLHSSSFNDGELPATANIKSGYVFRVENEAMVWFLQSIGATGSLTHLKVRSNAELESEHEKMPAEIERKVDKDLMSPLKEFFLLWTAPTIFLSQEIIRKLLHNYNPQRFSDSWLSLDKPTVPFVVAASLVVLSRFISLSILHARTQPSWHGAPEPGVHGSLLVLLSQDRWIRIDGLTDDLKAITSGSWLSPATPYQDFLSQSSSLMVWLAVILLCSASGAEKTMVMVTVLAMHVNLSFGVISRRIKSQGMTLNGRRICVDRRKGDDGTGVKKYKRRLDMAEELIKETGRRDWAEKMGMVKQKPGKGDPAGDEGLTM
jgi:hypothetical protein